MNDTASDTAVHVQARAADATHTWLSARLEREGITGEIVAEARQIFAVALRRVVLSEPEAVLRGIWAQRFARATRFTVSSFKPFNTGTRLENEVMAARFAMAFADIPGESSLATFWWRWTGGRYTVNDHGCWYLRGAEDA